MNPPAPVSGEICVEMARMPVGRIAAMKTEPLAFTSGSNLTFESRLGFPSDLPNMVVGLQAAINRFVGEANVDPKPFAWLADPNKSIFAVRRGYEVLESIHEVGAKRATKNWPDHGQYVGQQSCSGFGTRGRGVDAFDSRRCK